MSDPRPPKPIPARYLRPTVLDWNTADFPPVPIAPVPVEERFRQLPRRMIEDYLLMDVMKPDVKAAALAELARRDTPHPCG